jgi:hypothetical protein
VSTNNPHLNDIRPPSTLSPPRSRSAASNTPSAGPDFQTRFFDEFLRKTAEKGNYTPVEVASFHKSIQDQLAAMRDLHSNAERHIAPIIDAAIRQER